MNPSLALQLWLVLLLLLMRFDPARERKPSLALWVPVIWMFIAGSRLPSQWLGGGVSFAANASEEGNSLDRIIYSSLILLSIAILVSRSFQWGAFVQQNRALTAFLLFAMVSVVWSDFPFIAFKRWFRDLGDYVVILVVLSDRKPLDAIRTVLRRLSYLLVPLSILLIKYFPELGNHYSYWTGAVEFVGAATSKNTLGGMCIFSGLTFFWHTAHPMAGSQAIADVAGHFGERCSPRDDLLVITALEQCNFPGMSAAGLSGNCSGSYQKISAPPQAAPDSDSRGLHPIRDHVIIRPQWRPGRGCWPRSNIYWQDRYLERSPEHAYESHRRHWI